jgi:hypothetical protein
LRNLALEISAPVLRFLIPQIFRVYPTLIFIDSGIIVEQNVANLLSLDVIKDKAFITSDQQASVIIFDTKSYLQSGIVQTLVNNIQRDQESFRDVSPSYETIIGEKLPVIPEKFFRTILIKNSTIPQLYKSSVLSYPNAVSIGDQCLEYFSTTWWNLARETPLYEKLLFEAVQTLLEKHSKKLDSLVKERERDITLLWASQHLLKIKLRKLRYSIKCALGFGSKKNKYLSKKQEIKSLYRAAKSFIREHNLR